MTSDSGHYRYLEYISHTHTYIYIYIYVLFKYIYNNTLYIIHANKFCECMISHGMFPSFPSASASEWVWAWLKAKKEISSVVILSGSLDGGWHTYPSGNLLHSYGKIHHFQWENSLFQWWFSVAMFNYQRLPHWTIWHNTTKQMGK